jgi:hypothetical protein
VAGVGAPMGHAVAGDGLSEAVSREEPGLERIELPIVPPQRQQVRREPHQAIALPLALAHLDDHALGVDVGAPQLTECGDAPARGREDDGEGLRLLGGGDRVDHPGAVQGGLVEKASGTDRLHERAPGRLLLRQEVRLGGADGVRAQALWGRVEVLGALGDTAQIRGNGGGRVVADLPVFAQTLPEGVSGILKLHSGGQVEMVD